MSTTTDRGIKTPNLYEARDDLQESLENGHKALNIVNKAIAEEEAQDETRSNQAPT